MVAAERGSAGRGSCRTTSPMTRTTSTTACAPICSRSTISPRFRSSATSSRDRRPAARARAAAPRARDGAPPDHAHDRGRDRRDRPARGRAQAHGRRGAQGQGAAGGIFAGDEKGRRRHQGLPLSAHVPARARDARDGRGRERRARPVRAFCRNAGRPAGGMGARAALADAAHAPATSPTTSPA